VVGRQRAAEGTCRPNLGSGAVATTPLSHGATPSAFCLPDAGADFADAVRDDEPALARHALTLPARPLPPGSWKPDLWAHADAAHPSLLLAQGAVVRQVTLGGRTSTQFARPGDILDSWTPRDDLLGCSRRWSIQRRAHVVALDERFAEACRRWPRLADVVVARLCTQLERAATMTAISRLPRVQLRILAFLWHVARDFGRVERGGIAIDLDLTHELIGACVGACRPTVTLSLGARADDGLVRRRSDGVWAVSSDSRRMLHDHPVGDAG